jgi:flagellar motor switch protein FliG
MFAMMLEADNLAGLLRQLNDRERLQVIEAYQNFSREATATQSELSSIAKEFLETRTVTAPNRFREALELAFGPDAAVRLGSSSQWAKIAERVKPVSMADFLRPERANTAAVVLSQLPPVYAAQVLGLLPEQQRCEVVDILAGGLNPSATLVEAVLTAIEENLESMNTSADPAQGARQAAAMLNQLDSQTADEIVEHIRNRDPGRASSIEREMFHFEDLAKLDNRSLQTILAEVKRESLALALKGTLLPTREALFAALAEQVKAAVVQEMQDLGKVPGRDVREARREVIDLVMQMARDGKVRLRQDEDLLE